MSTATTTIDKTTSFYLSLMILGLTGLALGLEILAAAYISDGILAGVLLILFIALINGGQILTTSLTQQFKDNPQASFVTAILVLLLTVVSGAFLFMAMEIKLENDKLAKVRENPLIQQALFEYNTAKDNYEASLEQASKNVAELKADMQQAAIIDNQILQLRNAALSRFNAENQQWRIDFEQHIQNTTYTWASGNETRTYAQIADITYNNGFSCEPKVANRRGEKFITPAKAVCEKLNNSYPKPKPMEGFIDQQKLSLLQNKSLELSAANSALWRINNAQNIMQQKQQALLDLENNLSTDNVSWDIIERIADMTNQPLAYVETLWLLASSGLLYLIRNAMVWLLSFSGVETRQQKVKSEYIRNVLISILTHNRDFNIALLVACAAIISALVGYYIEGYLLMFVFAVVIGIVTYLGLSYYPIDTAIDVTQNNLSNVTVDYSDIIEDFEKVTENVTEYLNKVPVDDNVTKRYDNPENKVPVDDNVTKRYDNPEVTRVAVPQSQFGNVTNWFSNPVTPNLVTAKQTLPIGDNVTAKTVTPVKPKTQLSGVGFLANEVPDVHIPNLYPEWVELYKSGYKQTPALRALEKRYNLRPQTINNKYGNQWRKRYEAEKREQEQAA